VSKLKTENCNLSTGRPDFSRRRLDRSDVRDEVVTSSDRFKSSAHADVAPISGSLPPSIAGRVLGRYELLLPIAKGGMAQVWAARLHGTRGFQKMVAIKTILPGAMEDARMEEMFIEEATLASRIHHSNVVETLELGDQNGMLYLVMEWVDGESLSFIMARAASFGGLPLPIAVNLIGQACKGLHAAHDLRDEGGALLGVVHRDLSPQNVLVSYSGTAKLVDFGIAKATALSVDRTEAGEIKGKFAYMSPEQIAGGPIDRSADIFAMGILLYAMTAGRHPFKGSNPAETVRNICSDEPPTAPSHIVDGYPPALEEVVLRALSKSPDRRWASAYELLDALEAAVPESRDGTFEARVAAHLKELLGSRSSERRTELRLAQQLADRMRADGSSTLADPGSLTSLRAISVDRASRPSESGSRVPSSRWSAQVPSEGPGIEAEWKGSTLISGRSGWRKGAWIAGGAAGTLLTAFAITQLRSQASVASANPSTGSELAATVLASPAAPSASVTTAPAPSAGPQGLTRAGAIGSAAPRADNGSASGLVAPVVAPSHDLSGGSKEPARGKLQRRSPSPVSQGGVGPPAPTAGPSVSDADRSHPERSDGDKGASWDTETFGGRR
jgi:serine/threonine-protein kinase